jgi:hypothetical protein
MIWQEFNGIVSTCSAPQRGHRSVLILIGFVLFCISVTAVYSTGSVWQHSTMAQFATS